VKTFYGHRGWVKNIETLSTPNTILTASFDGTIRIWDLNKEYPPQQVNIHNMEDNVILQDKYIARMRITPDSNTLIVSLHSGQVVLIKNFDVTRAKSQLNFNFRAACRCIETALIDATINGSKNAKIPYQCIRKQNTLELLLERGTGYSTSLQLDPSGRYLLARRNLRDKSEECNIFDLELPYTVDPSILEDITWKIGNPLQFAGMDSTSDEEQVVESTNAHQNVAASENHDATTSDSSDSESDFEDSYFEETDYSSYSEDYALVPKFPDLISVENAKELIRSRLLFRIEDSGSAEGYIKEPCFTNTGRYIVSPYFNGLRIFDFMDGLMQRTESPAVHGLNAFVPLVNTHSGGVLTCRCHPYLPMLASGGMDGKVNFYLPQP
jgi:WD40 repeat protein